MPTGTMLSTVLPACNCAQAPVNGSPSASKICCFVGFIFVRLIVPCAKVEQAINAQTKRRAAAFMALNLPPLHAPVNVVNCYFNAENVESQRAAEKNPFGFFTSRLRVSFSRTRYEGRGRLFKPSLRPSASPRPLRLTGLAKRLRNYANAPLTTLPCTSVRRKSRPWYRNVNRSWSMPSKCSSVA